MRMTSAPPAMPASRAIQPQSRPMTSRTRMRWWLSAVVWSLSSASVAVLTALLNPKVTSVASRSLSIVFGHADHAHALLEERLRYLHRAVAADRDETVDPHLPDVPHDLAGDVLEDRRAVLLHRVVERVPAVRGAEDRPAARLEPAHVVRVEPSLRAGRRGGRRTRPECRAPPSRARVSPRARRRV